MDKISLIGLVVAIVFIAFGIFSGGDLLSFIDLPSISIVVGGTIGAVIVSVPNKTLKKTFKLIKIAFSQKENNFNDIVHTFVLLSDKARKEGLLSLEEFLDQIDDDFFKKGLLLVIDGMEKELIEDSLMTEIEFIEKRHKENRKVFNATSAIAPAFGMIGTLIGLINMLKSLSDPDTIGPQMAIALITTLYGSIIANVVSTPISTKLTAKTTEEILYKEMIVEGLLSVQSGQNSKLVKEKLLSFLEPTMRKEFLEKDGEVNDK